MSTTSAMMINPSPVVGAQLERLNQFTSGNLKITNANDEKELLESFKVILEDESISNEVKGMVYKSISQCLINSSSPIATISMLISFFFDGVHNRLSKLTDSKSLSEESLKVLCDGVEMMTIVFRKFNGLQTLWASTESNDYKTLAFEICSDQFISSLFNSLSTAFSILTSMEDKSDEGSVGQVLRACCELTSEFVTVICSFPQNMLTIEIHRMIWNQFLELLSRSINIIQVTNRVLHVLFNCALALQKFVLSFGLTISISQLFQISVGNILFKAVQFLYFSTQQQQQHQQQLDVETIEQLVKRIIFVLNKISANSQQTTSFLNLIGANSVSILLSITQTLIWIHRFEKTMIGFDELETNLPKWNEMKQKLMTFFLQLTQSMVSMGDSDGCLVVTYFLICHLPTVNINSLPAAPQFVLDELSRLFSSCESFQDPRIALSVWTIWFHFISKLSVLDEKMLSLISLVIFDWNLLSNLMSLTQFSSLIIDSMDNFLLVSYSFAFASSKCFAASSSSSILKSIEQCFLSNLLNDENPLCSNLTVDIWFQFLWILNNPIVNNRHAEILVESVVQLGHGLSSNGDFLSSSTLISSSPLDLLLKLFPLLNNQQRRHLIVDSLLRKHKNYPVCLAILENAIKSDFYSVPQNINNNGVLNNSNISTSTSKPVWIEICKLILGDLTKSLLVDDLRTMGAACLANLFTSIGGNSATRSLSTTGIWNFDELTNSIGIVCEFISNNCGKTTSDRNLSNNSNQSSSITFSLFHFIRFLLAYESTHKFQQPQQQQQAPTTQPASHIHLLVLDWMQNFLVGIPWSSPELRSECGLMLFQLISLPPQSILYISYQTNQNIQSKWINVWRQLFSNMSNDGWEILVDCCSIFVSGEIFSVLSKKQELAQSFPQSLSQIIKEIGSNSGNVVNSTMILRQFSKTTMMISKDENNASSGLVQLQFQHGSRTMVEALRFALSNVMAGKRNGANSQQQQVPRWMLDAWNFLNTTANNN